ncbi:hypothetical protein AVEN_46761-1 [Araneus ventricosus]|uniref:Uncharacterized protein n=1 Tax=Araneus ventricosus TaxID=182803 RepID=A0A4Y2M088_ARAVE|nr:hypothetical protein AVEN_46761-1 [Araneus ventricosus]
MGALFRVSTHFKFTLNSINHYNGYKLISEALESFSYHGFLPKTVQLEQFDEGEGMEETVKHNKAVYHKVCCNKYDTYKLRLQLSKIDKRDQRTSKEPKRSSFKTSDSTFFL